MSGRIGYKGVGLTSMDDKSRLAIPSALRVILERNLGSLAAAKETRVLTITTHEQDPCLIAYEEPYYEFLLTDLRERARAHPGPNGALNDEIMRDGNGVSENAGFDANGRFIMPAFHKWHANLEKHVFFYGRGDLIEIWDPKNVMTCDRASTAMKKSCEFLCMKHKVAL